MKTIQKALILLVFLLSFQLVNADYDISTGIQWSYYTESVRISDVVIKNNGTKMYTITFGFPVTSSYVREYTLTTPYDITSLTYVGQKIITECSSSYPCDGIDMSPNWQYVFITNRLLGRIYTYTLTTPYDISTATSTRLYNIWSLYAWDVSLSYSGNVMYVVSTNTSSSDTRIRQYTLSTPWDTSTATYIDNVSDWILYAWYIALDESNDYMFRMRWGGDSIRQYDYVDDITTLGSPIHSLGSLSQFYWFDFSSTGENLYIIFSDPWTSTYRIYQYSWFSGSLEPYVPPYSPSSGANCYEQMQATGYNFTNYSPYDTSSGSWDINHSTIWNDEDRKDTVKYTSTSSGEVHTYAIYEAKELSWTTTTAWLNPEEEIYVRASGVPWDLTSLYMSVSRFGGMDYIEVYGSWAEDCWKSIFQLWIFSSAGITDTGPQLLWEGKFFNFNQKINLKTYSDTNIYAIVVYFPKYWGFGDLFGACYDIWWIEYGKYELNKELFEFCIEEDGTVYRTPSGQDDWIIWTGSLDEGGDIEPLPSVDREEPTYTGTGWTIEWINDILWIINSSYNKAIEGGNNLIELIKAILTIGNTSESKDLFNFDFHLIPKANASTMLDIESQVTKVEDNTDYIWHIVRFMFYAMVAIFLIATLLIFLIM